MNKDLRIKIKIDGETSELKVMQSDFKKLSNTINKSANSTKSFQDRMKLMGHLTGGIYAAHQAFEFLNSSISGFIKTSDKMKNVENRLNLVTKSTKELKTAEEELFLIAQASRVAYSDTADLYARMARSTDELNISQKDLLTVTDTISKTLTISGGSADSMNAALMQLGQGFASGTLRGEELNSVMEQTPRLAQAISDGMGITIGQLREYGKSGKLTAKEVIDALKGQAKAVSFEFGMMDITVEQAYTNMSNSTDIFIKDINDTFMVTSGLATSMKELSTYLDTNRTDIIDFVITGSAYLGKFTDGLNLVYETLENTGQGLVNSLNITVYGTLRPIVAMMQSTAEGLNTIGLSSDESLKSMTSLYNFVNNAHTNAKKNLVSNMDEVREAYKKNNVSIEDRISLFKAEIQLNEANEKVKKKQQQLAAEKLANEKKKKLKNLELSKEEKKLLLEIEKEEEKYYNYKINLEQELYESKGDYQRAWAIEKEKLEEELFDNDIDLNSKLAQEKLKIAKKEYFKPITAAQEKLTKDQIDLFKEEQSFVKDYYEDKRDYAESWSAKLSILTVEQHELFSRLNDKEINEFIDGKEKEYQKSFYTYDKLKTVQDGYKHYVIQSNDAIKTSGQNVADVMMDVNSTMANGWEDFFFETSRGFEDLKDLAKDVGNSIANNMLKTTLINPLSTASSSLVNAGINYVTDSVDWGSLFSADKGGPVPSYSSGGRVLTTSEGFTNGSNKKIAGVTHGKEYVAPEYQVEQFPWLFGWLNSRRTGKGVPGAEQIAGIQGLDWGGFGNAGTGTGFNGAQEFGGAMGDRSGYYTEDTSLNFPGQMGVSSSLEEEPADYISTVVDKMFANQVVDTASMVQDYFSSTNTLTTDAINSFNMTDAIAEAVNDEIQSGIEEGTVVGATGVKGTNYGIDWEALGWNTLTTVVSSLLGGVVGGATQSVMGSKIATTVSSKIGSSITGYSWSDTVKETLEFEYAPEVMTQMEDLYSIGLVNTVDAYNGFISDFSNSVGNEDLTKIITLGDVITKIDDALYLDTLNIVNLMHDKIFGYTLENLDNYADGWENILSEYQSGGMSEIVDDVLKAHNEDIYNYWNNYATESGTTILEAVNDALASTIQTKRTFATYGLSDTNLLQKTAEYAQSDYEILANQIGVDAATLTVESFQDAYYDAIKNDFNNETIAQWNSLGDALLSATDAQSEYTQALEEQTEASTLATQSIVTQIQTVQSELDTQLSNISSTYNVAYQNIDSILNPITKTLGSFDLSELTIANNSDYINQITALYNSEKSGLETQLTAIETANTNAETTNANNAAQRLENIKKSNFESQEILLETQLETLETNQNYLENLKDVFEDVIDSLTDTYKDIIGSSDILGSSFNPSDYHTLYSQMKLGLLNGQDVSGYLGDFNESAKDYADYIQDKALSKDEYEIQTLTLANQIKDLAGKGATASLADVESQLIGTNSEISTVESAITALNSTFDSNTTNLIDATFQSVTPLETALTTLDTTFSTLLGNMLIALENQETISVSDIQEEMKIGQWIGQDNGLSTWASSGGAVGVINSSILDSGDQTMNDVSVHTLGQDIYATSDIQAYVSSIINSMGVNSESVSKLRSEAIEAGISAIDLDSIMGWYLGTSNSFASQYELPSFDVGTTYLQKDGPIYAHKGEIVTTPTMSDGIRNGDLTLGNNNEVVNKLESLERKLSTLIEINASQAEELRKTRKIENKKLRVS